MGCDSSLIAENNGTVNTQNQNKIRQKKAKIGLLNGRQTIGQQTYENITRVDKKISCQDLAMIDSTLCQHFLFYRLTKVQRLQLINCMVCYQTQQGQYVFKQGDQASTFFIISEGKVSIEIDGEQKKILGPGQYFGELALLYTAPRSASVKILEKTKFWCLSQYSFKHTTESMVKKNYQIAKIALQKISAFDFLNRKQKNSIAYNMHNLKYEPGQVIFKEGDAANSLFIIVSGEIQVDISGKKKLCLKPGDSFGQNSFKEGEIRSGTARCLEQSQLLSIGRQTLKNCLGAKFQEIRSKNKVKWALKRSQLFKQATPELLQSIIQAVKYKNFKKGQKVCQEGQQINSFWFVVEGKINQYSQLAIINSNKYEEQKSKMDKTIIAEQTLIVGFLTFEKLEKILGGPLKSHLSPVGLAQAKKDLEKKQFAFVQRDVNFNKYQLKHLNIIGKLGEGQFGQVFLVQHERQTKQKFALKCISKNVIIKHEMEVFMQQQAKILKTINFPLIVQLSGTYKDERFIYLLMQYIEGGDFFDILREIGILSSAIARFYFACLFVCIQYLHSKNVIYRDLKPENAVADEKGFLYLIDLGTAKILQQQQGFRTFTIIGTPHYMAPQVIQGKGYGFEVDIWSLGIILYEMVCGRLPYGDDLEDPYQICRQIANKQLQFPKGYRDSKGKQLIERLLKTNPAQRSLDNFSQIKQMGYFNNFDWDALLNKTVRVPYIPKKKNHKDKKYNNVPVLSYMQKFKQGEKILKSAIKDWDSEI